MPGPSRSTRPASSSETSPNIAPVTSSRDTRQDTVGNAAAQDQLASVSSGSESSLLDEVQGDREERLNFVARDRDAVDAWSGVRQRDHEDFLADTQVAREYLPGDPESILAAKQPDWGLFIQACSNVSQARRQAALQVVRGQKRWDDMLSKLGPEHTAHIQSWLAEDQGDATGMSLDERLDASHNSDRAKAALAAVQGVKDPEGRLTPRLQELLALGVGLPASDRDELGSEGILNIASARRAASALVAMPLVEYQRSCMLLELSGDTARLRQQFVLLEAIGARLGEFIAFEAADLVELESFSDDIRGMNDATLVDQTSVAQTNSRDATSLQHKYVKGDGAGAAQLVAAEADPLKALAMNKEAGLGVGSLNSVTAKEQEQSLERHSKHEAVARDTGNIRESVIRWLKSTPCSPAERATVTMYLNGLPYTQALYDSAIPKIQRSLGRSFPGVQAMEQAREAVLRKSQGGLSPEEVAEEAKGGMGASAVTGKDYVVDQDDALVQHYNDQNREFTDENLKAWRPRVKAILDKAQPQVAEGTDVMIEVKLEGGGAHIMTLTDVDEKKGRWLIHNTSNGRTAWVDEAQLLDGFLDRVGVSRGLVTSTIA